MIQYKSYIATDDAEILLFTSLSILTPLLTPQQDSVSSVCQEQ